MGINNFWKVVREQDQSIALAQLAEEHFKTHGRPLRIAVDEADWRFHNVSAGQADEIREISGQHGYQGVEKSIFYRICRFLTAGGQLLFVFDGPDRPFKPGRPSSDRNDHGRSKLLKELLRHFRIPYHEAPGEAEAECARLEELGVVDAVFSGDSDTMMFGSALLIHDDRVAKRPQGPATAQMGILLSQKFVRINRGEDIKRVHNFDRCGLVLFSMLCGGDYDKKGARGLPGCGPETALHAVKAGLGESLCRCQTQQDCRAWGSDLGDFLKPLELSKHREAE